MFPWDNAGATSSAGGRFLSDRVDFADADVRLHDSPLRSPYSRSGSAVVGLGTVSSATEGRSSQAFGEEFALEGESIELGRQELPAESAYHRWYPKWCRGIPGI
jgi:meiotic recombination protein REC8